MNSRTSPINSELSGQVAVVTGGGRGIGRAIPPLRREIIPGPALGNNADSVAEHALLLTLALLRQLPEAQANVNAGTLGAPLGRMLAGRTVCLYGLGATAMALARRLRPMGVRLIGITRDPAAPKVTEFALDECFSSSERHKALVKTDVLVLCVRLAHQTRGLVDASGPGALPAGALLLNAARRSHRLSRPSKPRSK